jgi:SAM-dependent methyltransferase
LKKKADRSQDKWPKKFPSLTAEQKAISDDFVRYWLEVLPRRFGTVDRFNHSYVVDSAPQDFSRTLEIGAGNGEHLRYERLSKHQEANYYAVEIRPNIADELRIQCPQINVFVADCQERMDFKDGFFDRIQAIHVLEHLPNLPAAVREMHRLCSQNNGVLSIVLPCEGSLAYSLARKVSAQRIFERRYGQSYAWFIEREHINSPAEIFEELSRCFHLVSSRYFPFRLKIEAINLCIGATLRPKEKCER